MEMSEMGKSKKKSAKELRKFGLVMTVPLVIIGALLIWKGRPAAPYFLGAAGFFFITGLLIPKVLTPIEIAWMALAKVLSIVVTNILLTLTFFLVITPIGLLMRLLGKDLLKLKFPGNLKSYWIKVEADGPGSRPDKPY